MIDLDTTPDVTSMEAAGSALAQRVRRVLSQTNGHTHVRRVTVPVESTVAPLQWLRMQEKEEDGFYWSHRDRTTVDVAGYGTADVATAEDQPLDYDALWDRMHLSGDSSSAGPVRYYGGIRFDARQASRRSPDPLWTPFRAARFVLPRIEMISNGRDAALACNLVVPRDVPNEESIVALLERMKEPATGSLASPPLPTSRTDAPDERHWSRMVRWALETFERNALRKVVFARRVLLDLERAMDPLNVLAHLADATPSCTHFAVRPAGGATFIGASPERLFRQSEAEVVSEAVAGTRPRGETLREDRALRHELLSSEKDRREQAFVTTAIRDALRPLCTSVEAGDVSELRLARGRHLHARVTGMLRTDVRPVDLLAALHPTPAVAGVPTEAALSAIHRHEPFDRGWYAGPVGWMGHDDAEFTVAIRSGLVRGDQLALYSGAGIVEGSDPRREWEEIEQKLGDFAAVLGIND